MNSLTISNPLKKIAFIGATGMLGRPVVHALGKSNFETTMLVRNMKLATSDLRAKAMLIEGTMANEEDVRKLLKDQDALHLNLSVKQNEKKTDWHTESEGLNLLLPLAREAGIKRIVYLSSLLMFYQHMNGFSWWNFEIKHNAIRMIKESGIPYTIFYPSTFMESITHLYKQGPFIMLAGKSKHKQYFIAAEDYARFVIKSLQQEGSANKDYVIQGLQGFTSEEAISEFKKNRKKGSLYTLRAPLGLLKFYGSFIQKMNYGYHILEAINNYPEKFEAEQSWNELGTPEITLAQFAKNS